MPELADPYDVEFRIDMGELYLEMIGATDWALRPAMDGPLNLLDPTACVLCRVEQIASFTKVTNRRRLTHEDAVAYGLKAKYQSEPYLMRLEYVELSFGWMRRRDQRRAEVQGFLNQRAA